MFANPTFSPFEQPVRVIWVPSQMCGCSAQLLLYSQFPVSMENKEGSPSSSPKNITHTRTSGKFYTQGSRLGGASMSPAALMTN
jgi:hypothetical protein